MTAGFWHTNFFTTDFWHEDFWQDYGFVEPSDYVNVNILIDTIGIIINILTIDVEVAR